MAKILAVDDDTVQLKFIQHVLSPDYEVITADNGKEAIEVAKRERPDLILMDVMMPVMDGVEATGFIKKMPETNSIPIIILTALSKDEDVVRGLDSGADDYLDKPFSPAVMKARVRAHLRVKELYDALAAAAREKEIILDVIRETTSTLDINKILYSITNKVAEYLNLYRCSIVVVSKDKTGAYVVASSDDPSINEFYIDLDAYPELRKVRDIGETLIIDDVHTSPFMTEVCRKTKLDYTSMMVVPIVFNEEIIGTMFFKSCDTEEKFTDSVADLCRMIANAAAGSINNASLYDRIESSRRSFEEMVTLKTDFVSMASHDIKTPIAIISSYLEILKCGDAGQLPSQAAKIVDMLHDCSTSLTGILGDMLEIGVIESGKLKLSLKENDMAGLVRDTVTFMKVEAEKKGIDVKLPPEGLRVDAVFDRDRIVSVITNIFNNAVKFTPRGGEIDVIVSDEEGEPRVTVVDTGCGIARENVDDLFKKFGKGVNSKEGMGLGLFICKKIIDLHGGRIWVDAEGGRGSSFHFTLPGSSYAPVR